MTRTDPSHSASSWETKSIAATDDGHRLDSVGQDSRPRGRIRRSMTACNTCRKLKTRCDLDPRGHACRRCLSLRFVLNACAFFCLTRGDRSSLPYSQGSKFHRYQTTHKFNGSVKANFCPDFLSSCKGWNVNCPRLRIDIRTMRRHGRTPTRPSPQLRND